MIKYARVEQSSFHKCRCRNQNVHRSFQRRQKRLPPRGRAFSTAFLSRLLCGVVLLAGCRSGTPETHSPRFPLLDFEQGDPENLVQFYFGSFVGPDGGDPGADSLVIGQGDSYRLNIERLQRRLPSRDEDVDRDAQDGVLDWSELEPFFNRHYARVRGFPEVIETRETALEEDTSLLAMSLYGVMTTAKRTLYVERSAVEAAIRTFVSSGALVYPVGTWVVGQHWSSNHLVETTVMVKREDGWWDYLVYDEAGRLAPFTQTGPKPLQAPTQCVGCHFGNKLFEPERSFPGHARPGPHGPREIVVDDAFRDPEIVRLFDEHRKRSDTLLGLYATVYVSELRYWYRSGLGTTRQESLLRALNLLP